MNETVEYEYIQSIPITRSIIKTRPQFCFTFRYFLNNLAEIIKTVSLSQITFKHKILAPLPKDKLKMDKISTADTDALVAVGIEVPYPVQVFP